MTIAGVLAQLDALKPHEYGEDVVIGWLADVEQLVLNEVMCGHWPRRKPPEKPIIIIEPVEDGENSGESEEEKPEEPPKWPPDRYTTATPSDTVLLVPEPYSELYLHYLCAQVDFHNAETLRYANSMQMFSAALTQFANWYNRTHMPMQRSYVRI